MKKPNITEGEWSFKKNSAGVEEIGTGWVCGAHPMVAIVGSAYFTADKRRANAKAISAVPEMIDALIGAHEILNPFNEASSDIQAKIGNALKKAGVKL